MQASPRLVPLALLLCCAVSLGSAHIFSRLAFAHEVPVLTVAAARATFASLLLIVYLRASGVALWPSGMRRGAAVALGVLIALQTVLVHSAVWFLPVTIAILVFYTFPIFTGIGSSLAGHERLSVRLLAALLCAFLGLALVVGVSVEPVSVAGLACALGASLLFSSVLVLTPRIAGEIAAPLRTFYMLATAAGLLVASALGAGRLEAPHDLAGWIGVCGVAVLYGSGITGVFLLLPRLGPTQTAIVLNLEPVAVAFIAWIALGESLGFVQLLGAALVVAAVLYYQARLAAPPAGAGQRK